MLLKRFREVGCAFGEVSCSLTQFVEQPRVLDGDDGLSGKVCDKNNLLVGKGADFLAIYGERADQLAFVQHRNCKNCPHVPKFDGRNSGWNAVFNVGLFCSKIRDVNDRFSREHATDNCFRTGTLKRRAAGVPWRMRAGY